MGALTRRQAMAALAGLTGTTPALAQAEWPSRPIRVVVPSPPGGPPDLILRAIGPKMQAALGQPVITENRAGGGGLVGTAYVARVPADGYTWLFTTASHTNIPPFNNNVTYDPVRDFTHVTLAAQNFGQALVVHPGVQATNLQELLAMARREPGKLTYVNAGNGTASHIPAELMKTMTGTDILSVPYRGVAEGMTDLLAGRVDMFFVGTQIALQHVQSGAALPGADRRAALEGHARGADHAGTGAGRLQCGELVRPVAAGRRAGTDRGTHPWRCRHGGRRPRCAPAIRCAGARGRGHAAGSFRCIRCRAGGNRAGDRPARQRAALMPA